MTPYPLALASIIPAFEDSSKFSKFHFTPPSGEFKRSQQGFFLSMITY